MSLKRIVAASTTAVIVTAAAFCSSAAAEPETINVWIGTGRSEFSKGIYHCLLNKKTGILTQPTLAAETDGPGFLAMHPDSNRLYAVCTVDKKPSVAAWSIEQENGRAVLKFLNAVEVGDGGATHLSIDRTGKTIVTAQYGGGSTAVFSLNSDGSLKERTQLIEHTNPSKAVPGRQDDSHAHWAGFSPDQRFVFVPDLGLDKVVIYAFDAEKSKLSAHGFATLPPGSGPRHMKFHPSGKFAFVLNEIAVTVTVFRYDASEGRMTEIETIPTVPEDQKIKEQAISTSEIRVHPNGQFVYAANRGHDTISAFRFDEQTGKLSLIEREHIRGATPRNFNVDPSGHWLLAAGQDSHTLASFAINQSNGELTYNRSNVVAPTPICVLFQHE